MPKRNGGKAPQATLSTARASDQGAPGPEPADGDGWITLRLASERTGVSISTLRNWYRKGLIDSRVEKGPNGSQRIVRLEEVVARTKAPADQPAPAETTTPARGATGSSVDLSVPASFTDLIAEHAAACERAGRAEARCEFLEREIDELRMQLESHSSDRYRALEAENGMLRQRLELLRGQAEDMARRLSFIEGEPDEIDLAEPTRSAIPPPEEDEFLPLTQRVRVRHKRKRAARREARRAAKSASSSSA